MSCGSYNQSYTLAWVTKVQKRMSGKIQQLAAKSNSNSKNSSPPLPPNSPTEGDYDYTKVDRSLIAKEYEKDAQARAEAENTGNFGGMGPKKDLLFYAREFYGSDFMSQTQSQSQPSTLTPKNASGTLSVASASNQTPS